MQPAGTTGGRSAPNTAFYLPPSSNGMSFLARVLSLVGAVTVLGLLLILGAAALLAGVLGIVVLASGHALRSLWLRLAGRGSTFNVPDESLRRNVRVIKPSDFSASPPP